jgi:sugar O-acyltransferase (sialic acid O-acetyltransferase NeuD family)
MLVLGAGGHGRVVAEAALFSGGWSRVIASDRNPSLCVGQLLPGIALVKIDALVASGFALHVAIGSNSAREREANFWGHDRLVTIRHGAAVVSPFSQLGAGCFVAATAVIAAGVDLGMGVIVNHGAVVDHDAQIGAFCHIAPNATLGGAVRIGNRVMIGSGAVVLPSVCISDEVIIGAGAVVAADITQPGIYVGVPARRIS